MRNKSAGGRHTRSCATAAGPSALKCNACRVSNGERTRALAKGGGLQAYVGAGGGGAQAPSASLTSWTSTSEAPPTLTTATPPESFAKRSRSLSLSYSEPVLSTTAWIWRRWCGGVIFVVELLFVLMVVRVVVLVLVVWRWW